MRTLFRLFALVITLLLTVPQAAADEPILTLNALQERIQEIHNETGTAAVGVAVVENGELTWLHALGQSNKEHDVAATPDTLFRIGSTSKMFVALAALKLVEERRLDLNTPLRELIPEVQFKNRWEDEHPVRVVHLLEHTTGWDDMHLMEYAHNEENPIALKDALSLYPKSRESRWVPGTRMAYSNTGLGVAGYVVEKIAGMPFEDYVQKHFFDPLGMPTATFYQPEDDVHRAATAYVDGEAQPYWHIVYRPAGSINASPREMANLLQFFLSRGQAGDQRLLPASAIERMETPHTTPGNAFGITSGYGLANYTSGFKDYGVAFHGHNGGVIGSHSDFAYAPELNAGYVILSSGDAQGNSQMAHAVRLYLLRDRTAPEIEPRPLPEAFQALDGTYKLINHRVQRMVFMPTLLTSMRMTADGEYLRRAPLTGGWESSDYAIGDNLLAERWSGLPAIAIVEDPLVGQVVQVSADLYQKTSAPLVWGEAVFMATVPLFSIGFLLYGLVWLPVNLYRKRTATPAFSVWLWPTIASAFFIAIVVRTMFMGVDFAAFGPWKSLSVTLFLLSLGYGVASVWAAINWVRLWKADIRKRVRVPAALVTLLHLSMTLYLASYGMIGVRLWTW